MFLLPTPPLAQVQIEVGTVRTPYNAVRVPNSGTPFSLRTLTGTGGFSYARLTAHRHLNDNHGLRLVLAPLSFSGTGTLPTATSFRGQTFAAGTATRGTYQFNSYRLSYWTLFRQNEAETWRIGGTLKVRDALIGLEQGATRAREYNLGVVPLLHVSGERHLSEKTRLLVDFDGLASPQGQGRAFDLGVFVAQEVSPHLSVTAGVRSLEGGADVKRVYNFARLDYLSVGFLWRR
jgi:hypothetical protein